jgi:uncharacterized membrane protein
LVCGIAEEHHTNVDSDQNRENQQALADLSRAVTELAARVERLEARSFLQAVPAKPTVTPIAGRPSLESRFGAQYLNRIGILALLVGASFAVHWAFTSNWIGPGAIIAIGLVGGIAIFLLGQWFVSRRYPVFGVSLQGLGLATLYLVLWAGFQVYRNISTMSAIAGMVLITAASVVTALWQDSRPLAVIAFLGGFATPFLLSTGHNHQAEFFAYVLILIAGMLATIAVKPWPSVLVANLAGCIAVTVAWFLCYFNNGQWRSTLIFLSVLYAIFIAADLLLSRRVRNVPFVLPIATAAYLGGAYAASSWNIALVEVVAFLVLTAAGWFVKRRLDPLYTTVALACLGLAVPAQFDTRWTTSLLWIAFGLGLMFAGFYANLNFIRWNALVLIAITVLKVFLYDLAQLATGYRIVAMTVLGLALLAISFVYQSDWLRLRRPQRKS